MDYTPSIDIFGSSGHTAIDSNPSTPGRRIIFMSGEPSYDMPTNTVRFDLRVLTGKNLQPVRAAIRGSESLPSQPAAQMAFYRLSDMLRSSQVQANIDLSVVDSNLGYFVIAMVSPNTLHATRDVDDKLALVVKELSQNGVH